MKIEKGLPNIEIIIRPMCTKDIANIATNHCPPWSTIQETTDRWNRYYKEQQENIRTVGVVAQGEEILGYGSLFLNSEYPFFFNVPEINDVWIYEEYRSRGLGTQLIRWLEKIAQDRGYSEVGIGVGLYADYGVAQKLYFHLGYAPDGQGVTYKCQSVTPGQPYPFDDELILWLKKQL